MYQELDLHSPFLTHLVKSATLPHDLTSSWVERRILEQCSLSQRFYGALHVWGTVTLFPDKLITCQAYES